jgi:thiol reductant ABC exporter CydC subunit
MTATLPSPGTGAAVLPDDAPGRRASLTRLLTFAGPARGRLLLAVLLGALAAGSAVALTATSAWLVGRAAQHPSASSLAVAIAAVRVLGVGRGTFRYAERLVGHDAAFRVLARLRGRAYRRLEVLAPAGLPAFRSGDLLSRLVADVDEVQELFLRVVPPFAVAALVGAGAVVVCWVLLPWAGVVLLAGLLLAGTAVPALSALSARASEGRTAAARGAVAANVVDTLRAAPDLVAYGAVGSRLAQLGDAEDRLDRLNRASARTAGVGASGVALLAGLALWGVLMTGVAGLDSHSMSGVDLAVIALTALAAFDVVSGLPLAAQLAERVRRSGGRVLELDDVPDPVVEPAAPLAVPAGPHHLVVRNLHVRWTPTGPDVLHGIDLDLPPGRRVAVVGPSGSGKTTLAMVLLRFLDPSTGVVTLDGIPLTAFAGDDVRRVVGLCAQDAHVFDTSLADNLLLARPDADDAAVAAALAGARLDGFVASLPQGLDTPVGEHGARLSGGQRQRLALARVLLADFPVVVLDEPAEHLDTPTADSLTADLLAATEGRTTVLVTHRLAGLDAVDEVVVVEAGRIVERGSHAQLLAAGGAYAARVAAERGDRV